MRVGTTGPDRPRVISPGCKLGWTACTRARSWVRRGATTSFRSTPVPHGTAPAVAPRESRTPALLCWLAERFL